VNLWKQERGLDAELPQQPADRIRCRCNGQRGRIQTDKERPWIRSSSTAHQSLSLGSVATKLRNQVGTNGDDARTALAALDRDRETPACKERVPTGLADEDV
jgi:hypothetical protein